MTAPEIAPAALERMTRDRRLSPAISVTEGSIMRSAVPTYGATLPDRTVETRSFGTPSGRAPSAAEATDAPADPPMPIAPAMTRVSVPG